MGKFCNAWRGKPVALFLFLSCFFLFSWPLISIPSEKGNTFMISYLFLLWLFTILGLLLFCCNEADNPRQQESDKEPL